MATFRYEVIATFYKYDSAHACALLIYRHYSMDAR